MEEELALLAVIKHNSMLLCARGTYSVQIYTGITAGKNVYMVDYDTFP